MGGGVIRPESSPVLQARSQPSIRLQFERWRLRLLSQRWEEKLFRISSVSQASREEAAPHPSSSVHPILPWWLQS